MDNDLDMNLYNEYLGGRKEAFDILYLKYKNKVQYFIFNIVKDYQIAEDITQEVFIYVLKNRVKDGYSFKHYIYLIARSRAISYINVENRRKEITEKYLLNKDELIEKDALEIITKEESKKEVINLVNKLDDKYKNAIYLVKIEGLSYNETAEILGKSLQDVKNLIHRGKKELQKLLIKEVGDEMNRVLKILIIILCIGAILSGVVYASIKVYNRIKEKVYMTPTYTSKISTIDTNKVWVGTFNLVWNDFMNDVIGGKIEFEDGYSSMAEELNKQPFTVEELSVNSYFKIHGEENITLKNKIEQGIKEKFNETSSIIDKCDWGNEQGYVLYAMLKKEFNYLEKFPTLKDDTFADSVEKVKYFGIEPNTLQSGGENVIVLFYNSNEDFAIKLKTKEGEEVYLYKTTGENKTFEENYQEMIEKNSKYTGKSTFEKNDILKIPFIKINDEINYDELCGRYIKGSNSYIKQALQTIDFELNNYGGSVKSEALVEEFKMSILKKEREFILNDTFLLYFMIFSLIWIICLLKINAYNCKNFQ